MKLHDENGRIMIEYENEKGAKFYKDAENYIEGRDFSDKIEDVETTGGEKNGESGKAETPKEAEGVQGFKKLSEKERINYLKNRIADLKEGE